MAAQSGNYHQCPGAPERAAAPSQIAGRMAAPQAPALRVARANLPLARRPRKEKQRHGPQIEMKYGRSILAALAETVSKDWSSWGLIIPIPEVKQHFSKRDSS
jgi:hypothetical protein